MNKFLTRFLLISGLFGIIALITSCYDRQDQDQPKTKVMSVALVQQSTPATPVKAQFYTSTLAEGIDLSKPGYPDFINNISGVSDQEPWGRWTDDDKSIFHFKQPLPKQFTLAIKTNVFGPNFGEVVKVKIGGIQQEFKITEQGQLHHFDFVLPEPADTIEFLIPKPTSPHELDPSNSDKRKLGLGLISLKII